MTACEFVVVVVFVFCYLFFCQLTRMKSIVIDDPFAGIGENGKICHLKPNQVQAQIISLTGNGDCIYIDAPPHVQVGLGKVCTDRTYDSATREKVESLVSIRLTLYQCSHFVCQQIFEFKSMNGKLPIFGKPCNIDLLGKWKRKLVLCFRVHKRYFDNQPSCSLLRVCKSDTTFEICALCGWVFIPLLAWVKIQINMYWNSSLIVQLGSRLSGRASKIKHTQCTFPNAFTKVRCLRPGLPCSSQGQTTKVFNL